MERKGDRARAHRIPSLQGGCAVQGNGADAQPRLAFALWRIVSTCETLLVEDLPAASLLARHLPAISLEYGETSQLEGTLDVLTRQLLGAPTTLDDRVALCAAFTAKAATTPAAATLISERASVEKLKRNIPAPTAERFPRRLTIGMATYDDYDGVYFTIQSIRFHNPELDGQLEFVVIDNNPGRPLF